MYSSKPNFVFGFDGLDESIGRDIVGGRQDLRASTNLYDWLGHGVYFWEHSHERALQWAVSQSKRQNTTVQTPFVIGAIINLGHCLDLLDQKWLDFLAVQYELMIVDLAAEGKSPPENMSFGKTDFDFKNRELDCAVIRYAVEAAKKEGVIFDSVRAAFWEGEELYPTAGFKTHNHIQISVINPNCIKGIFLPRSKVDFP